MENSKKIYITSTLVVMLITVLLCASYAVFTNVQEGKGKLNIVAGDLKYSIESSDLTNGELSIPSATTKQLNIKITSLNEVDSAYELYYLVNNKTDIPNGLIIGYTASSIDLPKEDKISKDETKTISLSIKNDTTDTQTIKFAVQGGLINRELVLSNGNSISLSNENYIENILNGADPVIKDNLIPITIDNDGTVHKADPKTKWYSYSEKIWANAIILKDKTITYNDNEIIPEDNIESYFVWIPKYSYQLWDLGQYNSSTTIDPTKVHTIPIKFGLTNTNDSNIGECTPTGIAGSSGNCVVGDYMTHPAFLAFDTNGLWIGKFETGYDGATSTITAQVNSSDSSKIVVKPNVYSWRSNTVGNMFKVSYDYQRTLDSHMMKNTEWGAVAYLSHSNYGINDEIRINNNSSYLTGYSANTPNASGSATDNSQYNTEIGYLASTSGNISGIFDISGGAWEYVMGYTTGATTVGGNSGIIGLYSDFYTNNNWNKYYDIFSSIEDINYNNRILGDATGEMGPFANNAGSWYDDYAYFVDLSRPWFYRGGYHNNSTSAGPFRFNYADGSASAGFSFRTVLSVK